MWLLPEQERLASPNCNRNRVDKRGRKHELVDVLVLHYAVDGDQTKDGETEDLNFEPRLSTDDCMDVARGFFRREREASAHFVIGRDGSKVQCVRTDDMAWHAGDGTLPREGIGPLGAALPKRAYELNGRSIGIEICNVGWAVDKFGVSLGHIEAGLRHRNPASSSKRWESYRPAQYATLEYLAALLRQAVPSLRYVCGHEDVTHKDTLGKAGAKTDPGPAFDWDAVRWADLGYQRVLYDFRLDAWVRAGDEVTRPIDVGGLRR